MRPFSRFSSISPFLLAALALSCAGQAPPSGGPPDVEPPRIVSVYPAPLTTYFNDAKIVLEFDEHVDHRSFEESVFISPSLSRLEFAWSGTEVEINFGQTLRKNTTYVVTIGTDVVDIRNRNRMADAFSLAFSTGNRIDPGTMAGRIYPAMPADVLAGVTIFAYKLDGMNPDTLNPRTSLPDYATQTGRRGDFLLSHVSTGTYRVIAVRDQFKNLLYDPETDEYGTAAETVVLGEDDTLRTGIVMRLAKEDTTAPRLLKVTPVNRRLLRAEFSEPLDTASLLHAQWRVSDTLGNQVTVESIAARLPGLSEFFVATASQEPGHQYVFESGGITDRTGIPLNPNARSLAFTSAEEADTVQPAVESFSVADSAKNIPFRPVLEVRFAEPVRPVMPADVVQLIDSLGHHIAATIQWASSASLVARPLRNLQGNSWYRLSVRLGVLVDWSGNKGKDTILTRAFRTLDQDRMSSIDGIVQDLDLDDNSGAIVVRAYDVDAKVGFTPLAVSASDGIFSFPVVPEGRYVLEAFRDRNGNGVFDPGSVFPFKRSERFAVSSDTVKVRARWPLEGALIRMK